MGYEPVQRMVGDVDPLRKSLKKPEVGLANPGQSQGQVLWRKKPNPANPNDPDAGKLFLFTRGKIVEFERSRYGTTQRGGIVPLRPDNLKFHVGSPMTPRANGIAGSTQGAYQGVGKDRRVLGVNGELADRGQVGGDLTGTQGVILSAEDSVSWRSYHRVRQIHHQGVLDALDQVLSRMSNDKDVE